MILVLPVFLHRLGPEEVVVIPSWRIGILLQKRLAASRKDQRPVGEGDQTRTGISGLRNRALSV